METKWVVFGAVASFGVGLLAYVLSDDKKRGRKSSLRLRRDEVVSVLKELLRESACVYIGIAGRSLVHGCSDQQMEADNVELTQVFARVFRKFHVSESAFRRCYEVYRTDSEIKDLADRLSTGLSQARRGVAPHQSGLLPPALTSDRLLSLFRIVYWSSISSTLARMDELQAQGVALNQFDSRFQSTVQGLEREAEALKTRLFVATNLGEDADSTLKLAVEIYASEQNFLRAYNELEEDYRAVMQRIALQRVTSEDRTRAQERQKLAQKLLAQIAT